MRIVGNLVEQCGEVHARGRGDAVGAARRETGRVLLRVSRYRPGHSGRRARARVRGVLSGRQSVARPRPGARARPGDRAPDGGLLRHRAGASERAGPGHELRLRICRRRRAQRVGEPLAGGAISFGGRACPCCSSTTSSRCSPRSCTYLRQLGWSARGGRWRAAERAVHEGFAPDVLAVDFRLRTKPASRSSSAYGGSTRPSRR